MIELDYATLHQAVTGTGVALRASTRLGPAGGPGSKIMPPTYGVAEDAVHKYAWENRITEDGEIVKTVLLDSVASQANRMEEALQDGWDLGELVFPAPAVDFSEHPELADIGSLSVLQVPHRIADAIFRDSLLDNTLFRLSNVGRAITDASPKNATALLQHCPTALVFGMWDSTGPKGGLGSKFSRAIVSEIVGFNAEIGVTVGSRIDPLDIRKGVQGIVSDADENWSINKGVKEKEQLRPSEINHGNIVPSIDKRAGGVTIGHALQTAVISLPAIRRLRFPIDNQGNAIEPSKARQAREAAHTLITALAVAAQAYQHELDHDLRSRCLLVPEHAPTLELMHRDGQDPTPLSISRQQASAVLAEANKVAMGFGLGFEEHHLMLKPAPKFVELLLASRDIAKAERSGAE